MQVHDLLAGVVGDVFKQAHDCLYLNLHMVLPKVAHHLVSRDQLVLVAIQLFEQVQLAQHAVGLDVVQC